MDTWPAVFGPTITNEMKLFFFMQPPAVFHTQLIHVGKFSSTLVRNSDPLVDYVAYYHWFKTLERLYDLSSFSDRARITCHVASPSCTWLWNSRARRFLGSHKFFWIVVRLEAATWSRIVPNFPISFSGTVIDISGQFTAEGNGKRIPSAIITGTQPNATDSTSLGLHGAHPSGHKQKTDRTISDW